VKNLKNILVPTDFSEYSLAISEYLCSLAGSGEITVHLLHVVTEPVNEVYYSGFGIDPVNILQHGIEGAQKDLQDVVARRLHFDGDVRQVVRQGEPSREIVRYAEEEGIDLILMATHGRTGVSHVLVGSVAEKVVRYSPVPVLTVKPEALRSPRFMREDVEEQLHLRSR
jgi:universal stress protein A